VLQNKYRTEVRGFACGLLREERGEEGDAQGEGRVYKGEKDGGGVDEK